MTTTVPLPPEPLSSPKTTPVEAPLRNADRFAEAGLTLANVPVFILLSPSTVTASWSHRDISGSSARRPPALTPLPNPQLVHEE